MWDTVVLHRCIVFKYTRLVCLAHWCVTYCWYVCPFYIGMKSLPKPCQGTWKRLRLFGNHSVLVLTTQMLLFSQLYLFKTTYYFGRGVLSFIRFSSSKTSTLTLVTTWKRLLSTLRQSTRLPAELVYFFARRIPTHTTFMRSLGKTFDCCKKLCKNEYPNKKWKKESFNEGLTRCDFHVMLLKRCFRWNFSTFENIFAILNGSSVWNSFNYQASVVRQRFLQRKLELPLPPRCLRFWWWILAHIQASAWLCRQGRLWAPWEQSPPFCQDTSPGG